MESINSHSISRPKISLYPNPATESFHVSGIDGSVKLIISNMHCRVFISIDIENEEEVCLKSLPKGIYIAKIITDEWVERRKLEKK